MNALGFQVVDMAEYDQIRVIAPWLGPNGNTSLGFVLWRGFKPDACGLHPVIIALKIVGRKEKPDHPTPAPRLSDLLVIRRAPEGSLSRRAGGKA